MDTELEVEQTIACPTFKTCASVASGLIYLLTEELLQRQYEIESRLTLYTS